MDDKRKFIGEPIEFAPSALRASEEAGVDYATANDITIRYKLNTSTSVSASKPCPGSAPTMSETIGFSRFSRSSSLISDPSFFPLAFRQPFSRRRHFRIAFRQYLVEGVAVSLIQSRADFHHGCINSRPFFDKKRKYHCSSDN